MTDIPPPFDALWFRLLIGLIVGLCLGSFATMLSYRLPRRMSIIKPDSHCPSCQTPLTALDLIPVASWLMYGGKCSHCRNKIGARYPLIELATGFGGMIAFAMIGFQPLLVVALGGVLALVTALTIQLERKKL